MKEIKLIKLKKGTEEMKERLEKEIFELNLTGKKGWRSNIGGELRTRSFSRGRKDLRGGELRYGSFSRRRKDLSGGESRSRSFSRRRGRKDLRAGESRSRSRSRSRSFSRRRQGRYKRRKRELCWEEAIDRSLSADIVETFENYRMNENPGKRNIVKKKYNLKKGSYYAKNSHLFMV